MLTDLHQVNRRGIKPTRILSKKAKDAISAEIKRGRYNDRKDANEPAYMMPSVDPEEYSLVCSTLC